MGTYNKVKEEMGALNNAYEDVEDDLGDEYEEEEGDCVEEEYFEEPGDPKLSNSDYVNDNEEDEQDEHVDIHGDESDTVFSQGQEESQETKEDKVTEAEEEEEEEEEEETPKAADEVDTKKEDEEEEEEKEKEEVVELTEEEKHTEYVFLDGLQRQMDEERYTLRKLRSIIGHQSEDIERARKKIADYTRDAQDTKAEEGIHKLKVLKGERERAVEERRISTEALSEVRAKREEKLHELRKRGLIVNPSTTYLIKDMELKNLFSEIKCTLLKYNSFAVLKYSPEELDDVIFNVANVCDNIDDFLTQKNARPRDINKLNTKERRTSVLYDKLIKWRIYKAENPDIRPTDYESFLYDPDDMFSDNEEEAQARKARPRKREMRAVRGNTPPSSARDTSTSNREDSAEKKAKVSNRSPIRPPTPPLMTSQHSPPPPKARPARRAVCGGSEEDDKTAESTRERPLRAERNNEKEPDSSHVPSTRPIRKRRPDHLENDNFKRRNMSPGHSRYSPPPRHSSPPPRRYSGPPRRSPPMRRERPPFRPARDSGGPPRREAPRPALLSTPPSKPRRRSNSFEDRRALRRSPSPEYRPRERENFQISVKNDPYRPRRDEGAHRGSSRFRHRGGGRARSDGGPPRRTDDRRSGGSSYRR